MALRLGVDLDGTLADMGARLEEIAAQIDRASADSSTASVGDAPEDAHGASADDEPESGPRMHRFAEGADALRDTSHLRGASPEVWGRIARTENFWETLDEIEPGAVQELSELAQARRWETIFLTSRPSSEGGSTQLQSQRWLTEKGFVLPAVFVTNGSRGKIARSLGLDVVVDDNPENCIDIATDSGARAILVWRGTTDRVPQGVKKLGIGPVKTMSECLTALKRLDDNGQSGPLLGVFKRLFGLRG